ncbi:unnamed protein product [Orchesella dallaii]|uniref:C2H2-type domain-containing protein n=1 Tax=Orchesella dallaii TaxID=48710 RepID=A0ABP1PZ25_9HEXA
MFSSASCSPPQEGQRCLFCFSLEKSNSDSFKSFFDQSPLQDATLDQLGPIFILRVMLGVGQKDLEMFLQTAGHPSTWGITVCGDCKHHVIQAVGIQKKIIRLRSQLLEIKKDCIQSIQGSMERSNKILKLVCEPVRDNVRLMACSGELNADSLQCSDGDSTSLLGMNHDWSSAIVKQEREEDEDTFYYDLEEPMLSPDDTPSADNSGSSYQELKEEDQSTAKSRNYGSNKRDFVRERDPSRSTRAFSKLEDSKVDVAEEDDPDRRVLRKRTISSRKLSVETSSRPTNVKDPEFNPSDSDFEESSSDSDEDDHRGKRKKSQTVKANDLDWNNIEEPGGQKVRKGKVKCPRCKTVWTSEINMQNHFNLAHSVILDGEHTQCNNCHLAFEDQQSVEIHNEFTHSKNVFNCEKCLKIYDNQAAVDKHKRRRDRNQLCEICSVQCCSAADLKQHIKNFHPEIYKHRRLQEHEDKVKKIQQWKEQNKVELICEKCGKVLTSTIGYKRHNCGLIPEKPKSKVRCSICEQDFVKISMLKLHQCRQHAEELNLTTVACPMCRKLYPDNLVLSEHIKQIHDTPSSLVCEQCGCGFSKASQLSRHMLKHGERTIICSECPSAFWYQRELDSHVLLKHTPYHLRPNWCNICQKRFTSATKLYSHRRIHEGNSVYKCKVCDQTFAQPNYLYCHVSKQHGQRLKKKELEEARVLKPQSTA